MKMLILINGYLNRKKWGAKKKKIGKIRQMRYFICFLNAANHSPQFLSDKKVPAVAICEILNAVRLLKNYFCPGDKCVTI